MKRLILLAALLVAAPAYAQDDVIYTPTSGTFAVTVATAAVDGDAWPTASVAIRGGGRLACLDAGPGVTVQVPVTVPLASLPVTIRAVSWSEAGCNGVEGGLSPNEGTLTLRSPGAPVLQ